MNKLLVGLLTVILPWADVSFASEVALFETQSAVASFVAEESACVRTLTSVFASNHIERPQKKPISGAFLSITKENFCTGTVLFSGVAAPVFTSGEFTVKGNMKQASLNATFPIFDSVSNTQVMLGIALNWSNVGRAVRSWSLTSDHFVFIVAKEATKTYFATASGQIFSATQNFISTLSQNATVSADVNLFVIRD